MRLLFHFLFSVLFTTAGNTAIAGTFCNNVAESGHVKEIRVQGHITREGAPSLNSKCFIKVLMGAQWTAILKEIVVKKNGAFDFQLPDSLVNYQLIFSQAGFQEEHVTIFPELGNYNFNIILPSGKNQQRPDRPAITWMGENREAIAAAHTAFYHISDLEKEMVETLMANAVRQQEKQSIVKINLAPVFSRLIKEIKETTNQQVKKILLIEYLCTDAVQQKVLVKNKIPTTVTDSKYFDAGADSTLLASLITDISPSSGLWNIEKNCIRWLLRKLPLDKNLLDFAETFIREQATTFLAASALYGLAQHYRELKMENEMAMTLTRLITDFPGLHPTNRAKAEFGLFSPLGIGQMIPSFTVASLDTPGQVISRESMLGKIYLLEFWALWCKGCIMAIPALQDLQKKYSRKGFHIVSISLDNNPDAVKNFRQAKYAMNWDHGIDTLGFGSKMAAAFELSWIPRSVLVGKDGIIIAVDPDLKEVGDIINSVLENN